MAIQPAIVLTTINHPSNGIRKIAAYRPDWSLIVVGDRKTPTDWNCPGARFISLEQQRKMDSHFARVCPINHYGRKNIGYLQAIRDGVPLIAETDDDNIPNSRKFLAAVECTIKGRLVLKCGWENVYTHFTDARIWPRGFPLELVNQSLRGSSALSGAAIFDCPIQQYLADGDPDVDAVYRLTTERTIRFRSSIVVLGSGTYCPFNSQNTVWWPEMYTLLYLPCFVSFRMTDIWRSLVAQVCLYATGKYLAFRAATVFQKRNIHDCLRDFKDELPGYIHNTRIVEILAGLRLSSNATDMSDNMRACYEALIAAGIIPKEELSLLEAWLMDLAENGHPREMTALSPEALLTGV
jgi:hypothetical protein